MPISKQAKKKMRHDSVVTKKNNKDKDTVKQAIKAYRKKPSQSLLQKTMSLLDKAAKRHAIHANKASRLKSRLSKLLVK